MKIRITTEVELTITQAAAWFAELDDDQQARFFVELAAVAAKWDHEPLADLKQWERVGVHLRDCACATDDGRNVIRGIAAAMEAGAGGFVPDAVIESPAAEGAPVAPPSDALRDWSQAVWHIESWRITHEWVRQIVKVLQRENVPEEHAAAWLEERLGAARRGNRSGGGGTIAAGGAGGFSLGLQPPKKRGAK